MSLTFPRSRLQLPCLFHCHAAMHPQVHDQHWPLAPQSLHCQSKHRRLGPVCPHHSVHHSQFGSQVVHFQYDSLQGRAAGPRSQLYGH